MLSESKVKLYHQKKTAPFLALYPKVIHIQIVCDVAPLGFAATTLLALKLLRAQRQSSVSLAGAETRSQRLSAIAV